MVAREVLPNNENRATATRRKLTFCATDSELGATPIRIDAVATVS
jgi:hypothetical protein